MSTVTTDSAVGDVGGLGRGLPRITVGIPAYRNAATIGRAIESVLTQTYPHFLLLISDDGSPDETQAVCTSYLAADQRIRYVRQPRNLRYQNFGWLLHQCQTEYFVWLAGDDRMAPDFLQSCLSSLDANLQAVLVAPGVQFEVGGKPSHRAKGTYALIASPARNLCRFLKFPSDNSRMYGLFRTAAGQKAFPAESFHAWDWGFSLATLKFGTHIELDDVLLYRDLTPPVAYLRMVDADARNAMERIFPLLGMFRWAYRGGFMLAGWPVAMSAADLFISKHVEYSVVRWPAYGKLIFRCHNWLRRHLFWRFSPATAIGKRP